MNNETIEKLEKVLSDYTSIIWALYGSDYKNGRRMEHFENIGWIEDYVKRKEKSIP